MPFDLLFDPLNTVALLVFLTSWIGYSFVIARTRLGRGGLGRRMDVQRELWMRTLMRRDLRMIDTAIMAGLQQGTGFFASTCIFAIGGCFALIGSADRIAAVAADLPFAGVLDRALVEAKLLGLVLIFSHAFFKFGWAYRLFNYCSILIGAVPMRTEADADPERSSRALDRALKMNRIAGRHFNSGLRAIFFGIAYLGWFLGPTILLATTVLLVGILSHRQFLSDARDAVTMEDEA